MKTLAMLVVTAASICCSTIAHAEDLDFALTNNTNSDIVGIQISTVSKNNWEDNLIEGHVLPAGNEMDVVIADGAEVCEYDILITFEDNTTAEDREIDLCELGSYTVEE